MTRLEKVKGKKEVCPICGDKMVCVEKTYQGKESLQWQNENGTAHYNFDFKTKETTCNRVGESVKTENIGSVEKSTTSKMTPLNEAIVNFVFTELDAEQQEMFEKKARFLFEQKIVVTKVGLEFAQFGFDNVASIGQVLGIMNQ